MTDADANLNYKDEETIGSCFVILIKRRLMFLLQIFKIKQNNFNIKTSINYPFIKKM